MPGGFSLKSEMLLEPFYNTDVLIGLTDLTDAFERELDAPFPALIRRATSHNITTIALIGEHQSPSSHIYNNE
jgi:hypothetical protein